MIVKYIIFKGTNGEYGRTFPEWKYHAIMANRSNDPVVSAGFAEYTEADRHFECYGQSKGLNVASRPQDTDILNERFQDDQI